MTNNITLLLDIFDDDIEVVDIQTVDNTKIVTVKKVLTASFCPICGLRLHSKGTFTRTPNHQILQDGYVLKIKAIGRRWFCSNPDCSFTTADSFDFIEKYKRTTKIVPILILRALKDLNRSCVMVAHDFNVSDTYVHETFMRYIDLKRKPLTKCICIDEVYINLSPKCKYALIIMDFVTGEILDIVESRRKEFTQSYFMSIPKEERDSVEFLICDMYNQYINYTKSYFVNATAVTDSFHVLQWILNLINIYINSVKKRYQERDRKILQQRNVLTNRNDQTIKDSKEVYILKNAKWVLLRNPNNYEYIESHYNAFLGQVMDTYDWEREFMALDKNFQQIRYYKNLYEEFNSSFANELDKAEEKLCELIDIYENSELSMFREFAKLLVRYNDSIVASFVYARVWSDENHEEILRRLSNGPLESFNNKPSALRTASHGISNFSFFRNRLLWATRDDASILAVPKKKEDIINKTDKKRGPYKKKK